MAGPHIELPGGAGGGGVDIAASGNTFTSGTVVFSGGGNVTVGTTGQTVTISAGGGAGGSFSAGVSTGGNTVGSTGTVSNQVVLAGGNNITLSQATGAGGATITISAPTQSVQPETQTFVSGVANSETTYTSGVVKLSGLGNVTVRSTTGQQFQISVPAQSVQAETQTFVGGIGNSQTTYTSGTVNLSVVGGNMTIRSTTGNAFQFSVSQSVQAETQTFVGGVAASNTTYTSGTITISGVGGGVTVNSNTGQRVDISVAAPVAQSNQSAIKALGASNTGNTAGNTGVSTGIDWVLAGTNNVTISESTAVGGPNTLWVSGPTVGGAQTGISGIGATNTTYTSGTVVFTGSNMITVKSSGAGQTVILDATQSNQSAIKALGVSNTGTTAGNTGVSTGVDWVIAASGNVTASQSTAGGGPNTVWISVPSSAAQTNQTGNQYAIGNTFGTSSGTRDDRTLSIAGDGIISVAASNSGFRISASQSAQTQNVHNVTLSGNTAGVMAQVSSGTLTLAGGNNITLSQNGNAVTISGGAGGAGMSAGISGGNTSGNTGTVTGQVVFAGGNNITLSGSTNAGSMTITVSAPNLGAGAMSAGASNLGNTAGSTGITGTQMVLVGTGPVSLSQSTGANGGTLSINAPATSSLVGSSGLSLSTNGSTISVYQQPSPQYAHNTAGLYSSSSSAIANTSVSVIRMMIPEVITFNQVLIPMSLSLSSSGATNTAAHSISKVMIIGTRNGSTINAITGTSQTETISWASNTANWANLTGPRLMTFPLATGLTPGEYYLYYYLSTITFSTGANTTNLGGTYGMLFGTQASTATAWAILGSATAQTNNPRAFMQGVQSISLSATNQTLQASNITQSGTASVRANQIVYFQST